MNYNISKRRSVFSALLCTLLALCLFCSGVSAEVSDAIGWYCTRAKDHRQPRADAALSSVEKHGGYYIDHTHTEPDASEKVVYLTFDAGYENGNVEKILDTLKKEKVPGAFFILGHLPEAHPELVRRMADEGHLVCNHTYTHKDMTGKNVSLLEGELCRLETACKDLCGVEVAKYFRPPEGKFDTAMLDEAQRLGYKTVFWSFAYADWDNQKQPNIEAAKKKVLDNIHNGAVILLHPTSATNAAILPDIIASLKSQGYRFGTLHELTKG